jgi:class 3 adenylate cyclase
MKIRSKIWGTLKKFHIGLYFLFTVMVYLGSTTAFFFEKYSLMGPAFVKTEWKNAIDAGAKGRVYEPSMDAIENFSKSLGLKTRVDERMVNGKMQQDLKFEAKDESLNLYSLLLLLWLWPLYRHYFSKKPQDHRRIESRIINLPLVMFILGWAIALQRYFEKVWFYSSQFGPVPDKVRVVYIVSAVIVGTFVSYLNLELTGLYVRGCIAKPFFTETNPYGLKRGFAISLTLRYALMIFSLGMVPLVLCLYVPVFSNLDLFAKLDKGQVYAWFVSPENIRALLPILLVAVLVGMMLVFQAVSIFLYRLNVQAPVSALVRRMKAVAAGDFSCKTSVLYTDEFGQLKGHFNMMLDGLVERDHIKDTFGRYVSMEIAEKIMKSGKVNLAGEEIQATVLFSDIRGFTPLSETLPPVELIRFLNEYFTYITKPIAENKGVINKFMGDAVMAFFSPVFGVEDHQGAALKAALGMREALKEFNAQGKYPSVSFGVGVHSGGLVAGNVGTVERLEYTVLGDTVNVASRIESQTKTADTQILLSEATVLGLDKSRFPGVNFIARPPVLMKGKSKPMVLYSVELAGGA